MADKRLGILVGGGPAPGINSALSAATIEALKAGVEVIGISDGFEHLISGRTDMVRRLQYSDVSRIHSQGGSIIRTARANPTKSESDLRRTAETLKSLGVSHLITIGGEDTASAAARVGAEAAIPVAHIPKTIDNDLPLPGNAPTFGFETARHLGTQWVLNLMEESRTTNRWCLVVVMGRKAGHLALGIGKAAGAIVTVIPEDFAPQQISLGDLCLVLEGAIIKRRAAGHRHGIAVIAEGVAAKMDPAELARVSGVDVGHDAHGNIRLEKIPLASIIERELTRGFAERGEDFPLVSVTLGYELRCAAPIPFDVDYTRTLGYGAVRFLLNEPSLAAGMVCMEEGRLHVIPFDQLQQPDTGRIRTRMVDTSSEHYLVAREYMVRLNSRDLEQVDSANNLANAAGMPREEFVQRFTAVLESDAIATPRPAAHRA
jgi:6-phosphofructokinase 1